MTRFAESTRQSRLELLEDGIAAHRERESRYVTVEADAGASGEADAPDSSAPWIQYRDPDSLLNLDCTDEELPAVQAVVDDIGGATVTERQSPEEAEGTNLKVSVPGDDERVAMAVESLFREGFGLSADYRLWVIEI